MRHTVRIVALLLLAAPRAALAAALTFQELALDIAGILDAASLTLIILGLVVYFWGIAVNIPNFGGKEGGEKQKALFFWGLLVLFVMVSIWGIIQLLQNTLFSDSVHHPATGEEAFIACDSFGDCRLETFDL